ncbi:MAG: transcription antitermination factor NusB [Alphaproteobacteria bacterium]|nr:transcription antitermination factor NusB [Alphaproteobacteria bacterium]
MAAGDRAPNVKAASAAAVGRRAAARLTAVQALYQIEIAGVGVDQAIAQFLAGEAPQGDGEDGPSAALPAPDPDLFAAIVGGVVAHRHRLDEIIGAALTIDWTVARLEILVRLILEAGVFELTLRDDIPPKVSINEYVGVANAFFDGAEPGLINGVLDSVAGRSEAGPVPRGGA